jgi:plastocyanin
MRLTWRLGIAGVLVAVPAAAAEQVVTMAGQQYEPVAIEAVRGDTIRFVNDDEAAHNVYVPTVGFGLDLGKQEPGDERTTVLGQRGTFEVECVFHPHMLLTVTVE